MDVSQPLINLREALKPRSIKRSRRDVKKTCAKEPRSRRKSKKDNGKTAS
jgi:hypothetical protein